MKTQLVLLGCIAMCIELALARRSSGENFNGGYGNLNSNQRYISKLNRSVNQILNATVSSGSYSPPTIVYLWDLLPAVHRFLLLNQSIVQQLPWNVTANLLSNSTQLQWSTLTSDVQNVLALELTNLNLINLTFSQWGWSSASDSLAGSTLFSLLSSTQQSLLPNVTSLVNQLSFGQLLNTTMLRGSRGFGDFSDALSFGSYPEKPSGFRHKRAPNKPNKPNNRPQVAQPVTAYTLLGQAWWNAATFLKGSSLTIVNYKC
jgi:hypothetical protein